jgi:hypothetical protein
VDESAVWALAAVGRKDAATSVAAVREKNRVSSRMSDLRKFREP